MTKTLKRIFSVLLAVVMAFSGYAVAFAVNNAESGFTDDDFLTAKGSKLINRRVDIIEHKQVFKGIFPLKLR